MFNEIFYEKNKKQNASLLYEKLLKTYNYKKIILNETFRTELAGFFVNNSLKDFLQGLTGLAATSLKSAYREYATKIVDSNIGGISKQVREDLIADVTASIEKYKKELASITDEGKYKLKEEEFHLEVERIISARPIATPTTRATGRYAIPSLLQGEPAEVALRFVPPSLQRTAEKSGLRAEVVQRAQEAIEKQIRELATEVATGAGSITSKIELDSTIQNILEGIKGEGASEAKQDVKNWLVGYTPYVNYESDVMKLAAGTAESKQAVAAARTAGSAPSILTSMRANFKARPKRYVAKKAFIAGLIIAAVIGVMKAIDAYKLSGQMKEINKRCMNEPTTFFVQQKQRCETAAKYVAGVKTAELDINEALKAADEYAKKLEDDKATEYALAQAAKTAESGTSATGEKAPETPSTPVVTEVGKVYVIRTSDGKEDEVIKTKDPNIYKYVDTATGKAIGNEFPLSPKFIIKPK